MTRIGKRPVDLTDDRMATSIILHVSLSSSQRLSYSAPPVRINNLYQPMLMEQTEASSLLKHLDKLSDPLSDPAAPQIRAVDAIALSAQAQELWHSPSAVLRLRSRHFRFLWRMIAHRIRGRK